MTLCFGAGDGEAARDVLLPRRGDDDLRAAARGFGLLFFDDFRFGADFFPPLRAAEREGARRFDDAFFDDFFEERERFEEDFVERFLEEDRLRDAMGFLLFPDR
jgi:hypothetical protein